jgi:S-adenosylmethionine synthetase
MEIVERKGLGHPDTICDLIAESLCVALSHMYLTETGHVLHHNLDKMLLVAGQSEPRFGGGRVVEPFRLIIGDRATRNWGGKTLPVQQVVESTARSWVGKHLRYADPTRHVLLRNELRPGSAELTGIFQHQIPTANDTSVAVGSAPQTETERLVLAVERYLTSADVQGRFPAIGEDIKVMAVRQHRSLKLTVAAAFVAQFVSDMPTYCRLKDEIRNDLLNHLRPQLRDLDEVDVDINTLDDPNCSDDGAYLTVIGTSAEGADGGEVGRGNRVNGLITLNRPMSMEAAAGKNPVSHVGKIYNALALEIARRVVASFDAVEEANVWLCSQIGHSISEPWAASVDLVLTKDAVLSDISKDVRDVVLMELNLVDQMIQRLIRGEIPVC